MTQATYIHGLRCLLRYDDPTPVSGTTRAGFIAIGKAVDAETDRYLVGNHSLIDQIGPYLGSTGHGQSLVDRHCPNDVSITPHMDASSPPWLPPIWHPWPSDLVDLALNGRMRMAPSA